MKYKCYAEGNEAIRFFVFRHDHYVALCKICCEYAVDDEWSQVSNPHVEITKEEFEASRIVHS